MKELKTIRECKKALKKGDSIFQISIGEMMAIAVATIYFEREVKKGEIKNNENKS